MMHYILLTELETTSFTSCKLQGLQTYEILSLERKFTDLNLLNSKQEHFFEVDTQGINVLNILSGNEYNYRIISQSMAMEKTNIGGRTIQVQKLVWTLGRT
ncbi:unnamed protein product [Spodoptera littoralis]|uniref:Uncharacterized protein n=2 Tax=Spodoptera TaxID=7106 RepID=A0A9P0N191_SPOLI|nr:unnamed protein product [Spodoptera littoralis]CAH1638765.1 unnamed protein product [Spodoptera littoralis]